MLSGLALSRGDLERLAHERLDPGLVPRLIADPATRVAALRQERMPITDATSGPRLRLRAPEPADLTRLAVYLGRAPGPERAGYLGIVEEHEPPEPPDTEPGVDWRTLRGCGAHLSDRDAGIFTTMQALANWHATHRFCSCCGSPTESAASGWVRRCTADGSEHFPRTDPSVIVSVTDADERLLLGRGLRWPAGHYSVLAGFVEPGESFEAAVVREVFEESGVRVTGVRYLADQPWPFPWSLMVGCTARATTTRLRPDPDEMAEVRWVSRDEYAELLRDGSIRVPGGISIARRLIERWLGQPVEVVAGRRVADRWGAR